MLGYVKHICEIELVCAISVDYNKQTEVAPRNEANPLFWRHQRVVVLVVLKENRCYAAGFSTQTI